VADKVGKVWCLGSDTPKGLGPWEGEQRNMWMPTQQEALWSTAATCINRGIIRSIPRSSSKREWRASNPGLWLTGDASRIVMGCAKPARASAAGSVAKLIGEVRRSWYHQWQGLTSPPPSPHRSMRQ
jgi:hypothetical protein